MFKQILNSTDGFNLKSYAQKDFKYPTIENLIPYYLARQHEDSAEIHMRRTLLLS